MRSPTRTIHGETVEHLVVGAEEWVVVVGAVLRGEVGPGGSLTVQGSASDISVANDGALWVEGALTGTLTLEPGASAILRGFASGTAIVRGTLYLDVPMNQLDVRVEGGGKVVPRDAIPEHLLPETTMTVEKE
jgi:hypothetical protein